MAILRKSSSSKQRKQKTNLALGARTVGRPKLMSLPGRAAPRQHNCNSTALSQRHEINSCNSLYPWIISWSLGTSAFSGQLAVFGSQNGEPERGPRLGAMNLGLGEYMNCEIFCYCLHLKKSLEKVYPGVIARYPKITVPILAFYVN